MAEWSLSFLAYIVIAVGVFIISIIALDGFVSKRRESPKLKRLVELRLLIRSDEKHAFSYVEQDKKGRYIGTLNLPRDTKVPLLIWYAPRSDSPGGAAPQIIVEPMQPEGLTPGLDYGGGIAPEVVSGPMESRKPRISLGDLANEVYSGSYRPPTVEEQLPEIPKERWDELRRRLRQLMNSRPRLS